MHFNVTEHPTAEWTARQLLEACGLEEAPRYVIRDLYGERFSHPVKTLDIREAVIAPRSPWQNAYAERVIGSIRRECLDHIVVIGERHLPGILSKYFDYYNGTRTHLSGLRQKRIQLGRRPSVLVVREGERLFLAESSAPWGYWSATERFIRTAGLMATERGGYFLASVGDDGSGCVKLDYATRRSFRWCRPPTSAI